MTQKCLTLNQGLYRLIFLILTLVFVVSCNLHDTLVSKNRAKENARARVVQADQTVTPGNFVYLDAGETKKGKLRARVNDKPAVILDHQALNLIGVLIPRSIGPQALIQVFNDKDLIVSQTITVEPEEYIRLVLTLVGTKVRLVSATYAVGSPHPKPISSSAGDVLVIKLYDEKGTALYQTMMPYPFTDGFEVHPGQEGHLARSDSIKDLFFSIKIPNFSDQFELSFEQIGRSNKDESWQTINTSRVEVKL